MKNYKEHMDTIMCSMEKMQEDFNAQQLKAMFADAVIASTNIILVADLAHMLKQCGVDIGRNSLFAWLRGNGYLYRQSCGVNRPTQKSLIWGYWKSRKPPVSMSTAKSM